jgi:adenosylcobinamide-GDP ribazoletransferase
MNLTSLWRDFLSAVQFLTRIPVPAHPYRDGSLPHATKFFPLVGIIVGASAASLYLLLNPHLPKLITAALVLTYLVCVTGCFHEDALADVADGFGGGWNRDQVLTILRDSRIGSYGGAALALSLSLRIFLLASLPRTEIVPIIVSAHILCRWTTLPLSYFLPAARANNAAGRSGQGARVARLTSTQTLIGGTIFSWGCAILLLRWHSIAAISVASALTILTGLYYKRRIGGITGDCFGATNQIAEIAVYLCGVWA